MESIVQLFRIPDLTEDSLAALNRNFDSLEFLLGKTQGRMKSWGYGDDKTKINGGMLQTGTVVADTIIAGSSITSPTITGGLILTSGTPGNRFRLENIGLFGYTSDGAGGENKRVHVDYDDIKFYYPISGVDTLAGGLLGSYTDLGGGSTAPYLLIQAGSDASPGYGGIYSGNRPRIGYTPTEVTLIGGASSDKSMTLSGSGFVINAPFNFNNQYASFLQFLTFNVPGKSWSDAGAFGEGSLVYFTSGTSTGLWFKANSGWKQLCTY